MSKTQLVGVILLLLIIPAVLIPFLFGWVTKLADIATGVTTIVVATLLTSGVVLLFNDWIFGKGREGFSPDELRLAKVRLKRQLEQPKREEFHDQLKFVYRPLYAAVLEMKEGKDTLPKAGTVGTPINPWTRNPKVITQVVEVFDKYLALIENEDVRKGWEENKEHLRKGEFWYGKKEREWLMSIERQHTLIKWWLSSP
jgi:hypothetical protein